MRERLQPAAKWAALVLALLLCGRLVPLLRGETPAGTLDRIDSDVSALVATLQAIPPNPRAAAAPGAAETAPAGTTPGAPSAGPAASTSPSPPDGAPPSDESSTTADPSGPGAAASAGPPAEGGAMGTPAELSERARRVAHAAIFGAPPPIPAPPAETKPPDPVLQGIAREAAFIRLPDGASALLRVGEERAGVKLLAIGTNRVLVEYLGEKKELTIYSGLGSETLLPPDEGNEQ